MGDFPIQIGLKLWSTNAPFLDAVGKLYQEDVFQFIELYTLPQTFEQTIASWEKFSGHFVIHCPHSEHGFNLAQKGLRQKNREIFQEVQRFADRLQADKIIVHGGNDGSVGETIEQFKCIDDARILLENKPKMGLNGKICIGYSPQEVALIKQEAKLTGTVLDFGHAVYAANAEGVSPWKFIEDFLDLSPVVYHLGDGNVAGVQDQHHNFGKGTFDLNKLFSYLEPGSLVTVETPRRAPDDLESFVQDVKYLHARINSQTQRGQQ